MALLLAVLVSSAPASPVTEVHYTMGTYLSVVIDGVPELRAREQMRRCFAETRRLESIFSRYQADSELNRVNSRGGAGPTDVSPDMSRLLRQSVALRTATAGSFDVTIGAATAFWREAEDGTMPEGLRRAVATDAAARAVVADDGRLVLSPGVRLDFDGVAKGYAVDRCVELLRASGVDRALLSFGESSQYALGAPVGSDAWDIEVRDLSSENFIGVLHLRDRALSTSSVFGHERRVQGRRVGHIIDPRTGEPLDSAASAVVVASSATAAEAWSKALLIDAKLRRSDRSMPAESSFAGALVLEASGLTRFGEISFQAFDEPRPIAAAAEPLR